FGDARYAVVTTGFTIQKYRAPGIESYGTDGTLQMIGEDWAPRGYELWRNAAGCWETYDDPSGWPWADGARHLIECIERERPPVITPEHAYHVLQIMTKTMESGRTGHALPLGSTFAPPRFDDADLLDRGAHRTHAPGVDA
ncbi:MAG TPA: hypothetical protein VFU81_13545, partial [Thermomicrobiales bacterium]|nr:hypothetical protein [Thermomicrobiales bacterium]